MYSITHEQWLEAESIMDRMGILSKEAENNGIKMICDFSTGISAAEFYCKLSMKGEPLFEVIIYDIFQESEKVKMEDAMTQITRICNDPSSIKEARVNYYKNKLKELENE